ncbi:MAG TPA: aminotransferase class I/II-fold pyridoxal phosphate-dependent enzyme [Clostridia bacterium]|nr:aminotransferase class I/II-fold pyridoxal phosphate-dependent enzyme [Clostridia bacterium]
MRDQNRTPFFDAVQSYIAKHRAGLHMPGHMGGQGIHPRLKEFWGENVFLSDLTEVEGLDYLHRPIGVVKEAQELAAEAYGAIESFFLVNGSTVGNQAMILSTCDPNDRVIVQRNSHRSMYGALILNELRPIYLEAEEDRLLQFQTFPSKKTFARVLRDHPEAKTVFLTNPNYFGISSDIDYYVQKAHATGRRILVDEAHGSHFHFHPDLPKSAVDAGADMVVQSTHKTLSGLTQTSMLHLGSRRVDKELVRATLTMLESSSPSYILMTALDVARMQMATNGHDLLQRAIDLAEEARRRVNAIEGLFAPGRERARSDAVFDVDLTKLTIHVSRLGLTGFQVEEILNRDYNVEIELSDLENILAFITIGTPREAVDILIKALEDISRKRHGKTSTITPPPPIPDIPEMVLFPFEAYYAKRERVRMEDSVGRIIAELVTPYPPGIPITVPGEVMTHECVDYMVFMRDHGADLQGIIDKTARYVQVVKER